MCGVASIEPSFTTITSMLSKSWASALSMARAMVRSPLHTGIMTDTPNHLMLSPMPQGLLSRVHKTPEIYDFFDLVISRNFRVWTLFSLSD